MNWKKWFYNNNNNRFPDDMPDRERYNENWMYHRLDEGPPTKEVSPLEWGRIVKWLKTLYKAIKWKEDNETE